jgi:glucose-1-phosphatase
LGGVNGVILYAVMSLQVAAAVFDLGGVTARFLPERRVAELASRCLLDSGAVRQRLFDSGFSDDCDRGLYTGPEAHAFVQEALAWRCEYEELCRVWAMAFEPDPAVVRIAERLRDRIPIALLTNNGPLLLAALPESLPDITRCFDPIVFSFEYRRLKPDPVLFEAVCQQLDTPVELTVLIDDSQTNVEGAARAGLQALRFTSAHALEGMLRGRARSPESQ